MKGFNTVKATALAAALAISAAAPLALAQTGGAHDGAMHERGHGGRGWGGKAGFFGGIDLTDAQKTQLKQLHETNRQAIQPLAEQIRAKRQELRQLNEGQAFDEATAAAKLAEIAPLEAKMMAEQHRMRQEMLAILTPEQRQQLEQRKAEWQQKRESFKGGSGWRHGHGGQQPNQ